MTLGLAVELNAVDLIDNLAQQLPRLHVVEGVFEDASDDEAPWISVDVGAQALQFWEKLPVDEVQEFFTS